MHWRSTPTGPSRAEKEFDWRNCNKIGKKKFGKVICSRYDNIEKYAVHRRVFLEQRKSLTEETVTKLVKENLE